MCSMHKSLKFKCKKPLQVSFLTSSNKGKSLELDWSMDDESAISIGWSNDVAALS